MNFGLSGAVVYPDKKYEVPSFRPFFGLLHGVILYALFLYLGIGPMPTRASARIAKIRRAFDGKARNRR
jgi:hypothetical protein